jgi:hypothetical protein
MSQTIYSIAILRYQSSRKLSRNSQQYRDRLEKHLTNFAANLMKAREIVRRLKRETSTEF